MNTPSSTPDTSRRSLLQAAAWGVPAVLAAGVSPAFATSAAPRVNLYSIAANANQDPDGIVAGSGDNNGLPYYAGTRWLSYTITYGNLGPDDMPTGAIVSLGVPHPAIWNSTQVTIAADPSAMRPVYTRQRTEWVTPEADGKPAFNRSWFDFTLGRPIRAGQAFTLTYRIQLMETSNPSTQYWSARDFSDIGTGAADAVDTQPGNNCNIAAEYRMYNPKTQ